MPQPHATGGIGYKAAGTAGWAALLACACSIAAGAQVVGSGQPGSAATAAVPAPTAADKALPADTTAGQMLDLARLNLSERRPDAAQRLLEQLVARFSDAPEAERARAELLALYARNPRLAGATSADSPAEVVKNPVDAPPRPGAGRGWRISMILAPTLQDELRDTIGDRVFFPAGRTDLGSRARAVITAQAQWLARHPDLDCMVEGHADDRAVGADDADLAMRRAEAVLSHLVVEGVDPDRLSLSHHGASAPVAVCPDGDCAAQNRRAVLRVGVRAANAVPVQADGAGPQRTGGTEARR